MSTAPPTAKVLNPVSVPRETFLIRTGALPRFLVRSALRCGFNGWSQHRSQIFLLGYGNARSFWAARLVGVRRR
jgi:hypothetical protein